MFTQNLGWEPGTLHCFQYDRDRGTQVHRYTDDPERPGGWGEEEGRPRADDPRENATWVWVLPFSERMAHRVAIFLGINHDEVDISPDYGGTD